VALAIASTIRNLLKRIAPRLDSLAARLIAAAAIWTVLGLVVGGLFLSGIYRAAVERDFDAALSEDLDGLIAAAEPDRSGTINLEDRFLDPNYQRVYSGFYWQITPLQHGQHAQFSHSLFDKVIEPHDLRDVRAEGDTITKQWGYAEGPDAQPLRVLEQRLEFPIRSTRRKDDFRAYKFLVAGDRNPVELDVARFNSTLFWSFVILGAGLIIAIFLQVRVGLQPLRRLSEALANIRDGKARRLEGTYPAEIAPLAGELNSLIEHSAEVVGRARTHVSNLAHFLKTPLSVISSEASAQPGPLADAVTKQVTTMRRQVDHYLARARAAGALDVLGNRTAVKPVLDDLARVLKRIHAERDLEITVDCPPDLGFRGERQDLEEMAGNLMDNACKWAHSKIAVTAATITGNTLEIRVDDDGPGLEPEERSRALERGEKLDESVPGSGLGLAIVRDIAKLYGGNFILGDSDTGGLDARLTLPAIS
jgi:signal transduction histidine kinase